MSATDLAPAPTDLASDRWDIAHAACCLDEDTAVCGQDVTDEPWDEEGKHPECVECITISNRGMCRAILGPCPNYEEQQ